MNTTTLNMTTLDGGVIIKRGEGGGVPINNQDKVVDITENGTTEVVADSGFTGLGKVTINTEVSGSGGTDLEGEYFLAKPNGRYWKFTFSPNDHYIDPESLSAEQLEALTYFVELVSGLGVVYGAAVGYDGVPLDEFLRVDGVAEASARLGRMLDILHTMPNSSGDFNDCFFRVWKECSVKTSTVTETVPFQEYDLVSFAKMMTSAAGQEVTDEQILMMFESQLMLIPATEEEYMAARGEN